MTTPQTTNARTLLKALIADVYTPNGLTAGDCGAWAEVVEQVTAARDAGGVERARAVFTSLSAARPNLNLWNLVSGGQEEIDQSYLLDESSDDEGNAQCLNRLYSGRFLYCDAYGWLAWNGRFWERDTAESALDRAAVDTLKRRRLAAVDAEREAVVKCAAPTARRVRDCKTLFRSLVPAHVDEFDRSPDLLNVANGVIDLRTGQLSPHEPGQRFTYILPVEYDAAADFTSWVSFLGKAVAGGDGHEMLDYLQQAVGYSLTGHTSEECLWYLYGPTRSGKGTFTETLLALLPAPLGKEVDFTSFTVKRNDPNNFDLAPLKPARLLIASESNKYESLNAGKIKTLTGGNDIYCCYKHRDHFSYRPQFKIWLVSNHELNADVDDDAAWYRLKVIEFPNGHAGNEDKAFKPRMKRAANLRGVLRWAVDGARAWYASQPAGLKAPVGVVSATNKQRDALDYVQSWLDECCISAPGRWASNEQLHGSYSNWCKQNGVSPKAIRGLSLALKRKGFEIGSQQKVGGINFKGVVGIALLAVTVT